MDKKIIITAIVAIVIIAVIVGIILLVVGGGLLMLLGAGQYNPGGPQCLGTTNFVMQHIVHNSDAADVQVQNAMPYTITNLTITASGDAYGTNTEESMAAGQVKVYTFGGNFSGSYSFTITINYADQAGSMHQETATCRGTY